MRGIYGLVENFVSSSAKVGRNAKIWHYAYVGDNAEIGDDVTIGSLAHVDYNTKVGDRTRIGGQAYVAPLCRIGKDVFIGPAAVLTNDPYPACRKMVGVLVEDNAVIGARAVVKAGLRIGRNSMVAMGAVVIKDVPDGDVVAGVPATKIYTRAEYDKKRKAWLEDGAPDAISQQ